MRREEVAGGGIGAIKVAGEDEWTRREKVEDGGIGARSEQTEGRDISP